MHRIWQCSHAKQHCSVSKADNSALKGVGAKLANSIKELATNTAIGMGADHKPKKVSL